MNSIKVDFVVLWVDGNDPHWIEEKQKYHVSSQDDDRVQRYRDWDNMRYWFRGVEKFAPWVNRVFFVTNGQIPKWLNTDNPKLRLISHDEYMPKEYLPVFNSNPIELLLNRIEDLSEHFVLFNDDMFLIKMTKVEDFFCKGLPCDSAALNVHSIVLGKTDNYSSLQAMGVINKYFDMHQVIRKNLYQWFSPKYRSLLLRTLYLLPCPVFPEIRQIHLPYSYLKSTFDEVWEKEPEILYETCGHRFRNRLDYSHWTMRNWQIASGKIYPRRGDFGKSLELNEDENSLKICLEYIRKTKGKVVCINDSQLSEEKFIRYKKELIDEFERLLPEPCSYEK